MHSHLTTHRAGVAFCSVVRTRTPNDLNVFGAGGLSAALAGTAGAFTAGAFSGAGEAGFEAAAAAAGVGVATTAGAAACAIGAKSGLQGRNLHVLHFCAPVPGVCGYSRKKVTRLVENRLVWWD